MTRVKDHYKALGVSPQASRAEILKARNDLLKKFHPDLHPKNPEEAKERTIDILLAADVLLNESAREEYDKVWRNLFGIYGTAGNGGGPAAQSAAPSSQSRA